MRKKQYDDIRMAVQVALSQTGWFTGFEQGADDELICHWNPVSAQYMFGERDLRYPFTVELFEEDLQGPAPELTVIASVITTLVDLAHDSACDMMRTKLLNR